MSEQKFISGKNLTNVNLEHGNVNIYMTGNAVVTSSEAHNEPDKKAIKDSPTKGSIKAAKKFWRVIILFVLGLAGLMLTNIMNNVRIVVPTNDSNDTAIVSSDTTSNDEIVIDIDKNQESDTNSNDETVTAVYETTSWTVEENELTIVYRNSENLTYTAKFKLEKSDRDLRYIIRRLPANTKINIPDGWTLDTVRDVVTISDISKTRPLGADAVIISGVNTVITKTHDVRFTARYLGIASEHYATMDWLEHNGVLSVSYKGSDGSRMLTKTLTFNKESEGGDNRYVISSGLPAHTEINLPEGWTLDTVENAVDVRERSKIMPIGENAINIAGENVVVTKYSNVPFTARHSD